MQNFQKFYERFNQTQMIIVRDHNENKAFLRCAILAISNLKRMLLFAFLSTTSNFNNLFVFNLGTNFNMYSFTVLTM